MAGVRESQVLDALRPIIDPDFGRSIVDLGFVKDLRIDADRVAFTIELTTPACPVKAEFERAAHEAVASLPGVAHVEVRMSAATRSSRSREEVDLLPGVKHIIAVASGKGGVGKSTVAVNLALALAQSGAEVGLMDADIYGPSIPLMLRAHAKPRVSPERKLLPVRSSGLSMMSIGFVIRQFLADVAWGELDYLVLDLPPGTGDAALTLTQSAPLSGAVIVTTPQEVALIDARKGLRMFERVRVPVLGIVENMSGFVCPGCATRHAVFGEGGGERAAQELGTELLVQIPLQPDVVRAGDSGEPTVVAHPDSPAAVAFHSLAGTVARKLSRLAAEPPPILDANLEWVNNPA
jgi:ATP-binding protein involved in chromosome partitioning